MVRSHGRGGGVWIFEFCGDGTVGGAQHGERVRAVVRDPNHGGSRRLRRLDLFSASPRRVSIPSSLALFGYVFVENSSMEHVRTFDQTCSDERRPAETRRGGGAGSRGIGRRRSEQIRFEPEMYSASNSTPSTPNFTSSSRFLCSQSRIRSIRGHRPSQQTSESRRRTRSRQTWNGCVSRA